MVGTLYTVTCIVTCIVGLDQLLEENRISDLTLLYQLFSRVKDGQRELCSAFGVYIKVSISYSVVSMCIGLMGGIF